MDFSCAECETSISWYSFLLSSFVVCSPLRRMSSKRKSPDSHPTMNSLVYGRQVVTIARHWTTWLQMVERQKPSVRSWFIEMSLLSWWKKTSCTAAATKTLYVFHQRLKLQLSMSTYSDRHANIVMIIAFLVRAIWSCAVIPSFSVTMTASVIMFRIETAFHQAYCVKSVVER